MDDESPASFGSTQRTPAAGCSKGCASGSRAASTSSQPAQFMSPARPTAALSGLGRPDPAGPMGVGLGAPAGIAGPAGPMGAGLVRPAARQDVLGMGSMALGRGAGLGSPTLAQKLEAAAARSPLRRAPLSMTLTAASFRKRGRPSGAPAPALVNRLAQRIVEAERGMGRSAAGLAPGPAGPRSLSSMPHLGARDPAPAAPLFPAAPAAPLFPAPAARPPLPQTMDRYREPAPLYTSDGDSDDDDSEDEGQAPAKRRR